MINAADLIALKRQHLQRLANQTGAAGEQFVLSANTHLIGRPTGKSLAALLATLTESGLKIKASSFDAIALPEPMSVDFFDPEELRAIVPKMVFVEIKTANQARVKEDFSGFFFAFTEGEIQAAEVLGERHRVILHNKLTGAMLITSIPELLKRARSTNWQLSVQL